MDEHEYPMAPGCLCIVYRQCNSVASSSHFDDVRSLPSRELSSGCALLQFGRCEEAPPGCRSMVRLDKGNPGHGTH